MFERVGALSSLRTSNQENRSSGRPLPPFHLPRPMSMALTNGTGLGSATAISNGGRASSLPALVASSSASAAVGSVATTSQSSPSTNRKSSPAVGRNAIGVRR